MIKWTTWEASGKRRVWVRNHAGGSWHHCPGFRCKNIRVILCLVYMQYSSLQWSTQSAFISFLGNGIMVFPHFYFFLKFSVSFFLYTFGKEWNKVTNCFFERLRKPEVAWPAIPGLWRLRLEDPEFEVRLGHTVRTPISKSETWICLDWFIS